MAQIFDNQQPVKTDETSKKQTERFSNIALFGPMMVLSALNKTPPPWMRLILLGVGIASISNDLKTYFNNRSNNNV